MIRAVLAVALAVALVGASLPAVEDARADRTDRRLAAATDRIERAATSLADGDDGTPPDVAGARRTVAVEFPRRSLTAAPAEFLRIEESGSGSNATVAYALPGRPTERRTIAGVEIRTPDGPIVLREAGVHRLALTLVRPIGERRAVVVVRRQGSSAAR